MSKSRLEQALAEADEIEAAERTTDPDAPLPPHVKVTHPGHARSKVLQVRLNPEEYAALETLAEQRKLPVSTVARAQILDLLSRDAAMKNPTQSFVYDVTLQQVNNTIKRFQRVPRHPRTSTRRRVSA